MFHQIEQLEMRRLLTIPVSGTTLNLTDSPNVPYITAGNDFLEIVQIGNMIQVRTGSGTVLDSHPAAGITGININAGAGDDIVRIGTAAGTLMPNLPVTIHGGVGNDTLTGGNLNDKLFGDAGDDRLDGRAGKDLMDGGDGFDTVDYSYRTVNLNVTLDNSNAANDGSNSGNNSSPAQYNDLGGDNARNIEGVVGGNGADSLVGSAAANWIDGGGGNDTILGGDGVDTIIGGVNSDLAYGQGGDDYFFVQDSQADRFLGGDGLTIAAFDPKLDMRAPDLASPALANSADPDCTCFVNQQISARDLQNFNFTYLDHNLIAQPIPGYLVQRVKALKPDGTFEFSGTPFDDVITVSEQDGVITANINGFLWQETASQVTSLLVNLGDGNDRLTIDPSVHVAASIEGGAGNDTVFGSQQNDSFSGGAGNDLFFGGGGNDRASGDDGNDLLVGGAGADTFSGDNGRDILIGGRGKDFLDGGAGEDILIGGYTLFDDDPSFMQAVLTQWGTTAQMDRTRFGFFNNQPAAPIDSIYLRSSSLSTVFADHESDTLTGDTQSDRFFIKTNGGSKDTLTDFMMGDQLIQI